MKNLSLTLIAAFAAVSMFACSKQQEPVVDPVIETPAVEEALPTPVVEDDSAERARLEAERLEAERARLEAMINQIMSEDVYFDFDRSELTEKAKDLLSQVGAVLVKEPRFTITIEGHTDARGTEDYNMTLGGKRAMKVKDFLEAYGVSSDRLQTLSFGKEKPKAEGESEDAYQQNRRAHFRVNIK